MKAIFILFAIFICIGDANASTWQEIYRTDKYLISFDADDISKRKDGSIDAQLKWTFTTMQSDGDVSYSVSVERIRIECVGNKMTIFDVTYYSSDGSRVASKSINKTLTSGQVASRIISYICKSASAIAPKTEKFMGTGFVVSKSGYIVTCNHVIDGKKKIYCLKGAQEVVLEVIKKDEKNDIALLKMKDPVIEATVFRKGKSVRPGDNCVILGFPLQGLLAQEVNVTTGTVSASAGPGNDIRLLQTTAPVHQGNSGGPMFDSHGEVVGVVLYKFNALKLAQYIGDVPQNIGFALNSIIVKLFLDSNGIEYEEGAGDEKLEASQVVEKSRQSVLLIVAE